MGFGTQLLGWDADFCRLLAAQGRYVIRFDNRDCGLSTKFDDHPVDLMDLITAVTSGDLDRALAMAPYSLRDMATTTKTCLRQRNLLATEAGRRRDFDVCRIGARMSAETLSSHEHSAREAALGSLATSAAGNIPGVDFVSITVHEDDHTLYTAAAT